MKLFLAPTDFGWYRFLAARQPEEVNFWQPSASAGFHALDNGDPLESGHLFLFKLKGNINQIARLMEVDRKTVYRKMAELGIAPDKYRE